MTQAIAALSRASLTLAAVAFVVFATRAAAPGGDASAESVRCELDPPHDASGLEACIARSPRDVELLLELGEAYQALGRADDARSAYRRAVDIDPHDAGAQRHLAESNR
jgi:cytochrome c-type biogenesis protein CcmH/NrfG